MTGSPPLPQDLDPPGDLPDLAAFSARIGADALLIQAAGGNTSIKEGGVMWIKASGTLLADAERRDIFVPVDRTAMVAAMSRDRARADRPADFALGQSSLRPSIETSLHAIFGQRVVVHVHCVNTLALAIRAGSEALLAEAPLNRLNWAFVPYAKPGANLAAGVMARMGPDTDVIVLGNHGLIVAAETVAEAAALLERAVAAVRPDNPPTAASPDMKGLRAAAREGWVPAPEDWALHGIALDPAQLHQATGGSLYPDHVIFCGVGAVAVEPDAVPDAPGAPPFVLVRGLGALLQCNASPGALALARCLGDVLARVPADARLVYLSPEQNAELLDWDAEKYRQALNAP
jgi:rhamnose utilization protein RhaD (predicted bifunctional aldolase and dehydrogenase)